MSDLAPGLMVCGTGSDSGKSTIVAGLARVLARRGLRVAPFKAQNMSLNSAVTADGHEIGRAQAAQAAAAGVEPDVAMNPILLKPTDQRTSQVIVEGRPWLTLGAADYQEAKRRLWPVVTRNLEHLRRTYDAVLCEGAGSPAEINLLPDDIVNLRVAQSAGFHALLVGDIDRGGVFAALFGTVALLPPEMACAIRGFVINKFRGDPSLLAPGVAELERRTAIPMLGVVPWLEGLHVDAEDSLALEQPSLWARPKAGSVLDVALVRLPRISNFTDVEALAVEPGVSVRLVQGPGSVGRPDILILPGSKATVADLAWLRASGLAAEINALVESDRTTVLGICAGYQMAGARIADHVEAPVGTAVDGLGLLPVHTEFRTEKTTRRVRGRALGHDVAGYEIHHGVTTGGAPWVETEQGMEGSRSADGRVLGTSVHGLFENDGFRRAFLAMAADRAGKSWNPGPEVCFAQVRDHQWDRLADAIESHVDVEAILALMKD